MTFTGTPRPEARWSHCSTQLDHFSMITYAVDSDRLARQVPSAFVPDVFEFDDGTSGGLVSAVPFVDRDFAFRFFPWVKVACGQVNYRAYGSLDGKRGVWFFGTSLDSRFVALPRVVWQMPWHRDAITITASGSPDPADSLAIDIVGAWGGARARITSTGQHLGRLDGFPDADTTIEVLTHPMIGWYPRTRGGIGRYSVWHDVLQLEVAEASEAQFDVFERLDLVSRGQRPHSAVMQQTVHFDVHTPPRRITIAP